uniref:HAT C-terminal dimerisation domain-containing protein n=1 Tax=Sipha flava TaxID=143950 RepID=A0A2S2Q8Q9_9HEMI
MISSLDNRFSNARDILKDLALLSPERLIEAKHKSVMNLPDNCFLDLSTWITDINPYQLKTEYLLFSKSLKELINGMKFPDNQSNKLSDIDSEVDSLEDEHQNIVSEPKQSITLANILNVLSSFDIMSAFPNLYCAYKALCTIPASAERSFLKVKLIKNRLRLIMSQQRLESLMLISCERHTNRY